MPTPTYTLIQEQVLGSAAATVTFSSIPGTYKDLVLEIVGSASANIVGLVQVNGDTGSNYSTTEVQGNGTSAASYRWSTQTYGRMDGTGTGTSMFTYLLQFMSYSNTNVNKTILGRFGSAGSGSGVDATVNLWRSTSAITSINAYTSSSTWASGSTFRLWGVAG